MTEPRHRPGYRAAASNPPMATPEPQQRALERRAALNEQQREFSQAIPEPHYHRRRPPG